jgi:hypothetical protein
MSSFNQSPPRGRVAMASRPSNECGITWNFIDPA